MKPAFLLVLFFCLYMGCSKEERLKTLAPVPDCIADKIRENKEVAGESFTSVERWTVAGSFQYDFIFTGCCDLGGVTYDESCEVTCTVFGLTGQRSAECPDIPSREDIVVVWQRDL